MMMTDTQDNGHDTKPQDTTLLDLLYALYQARLFIMGGIIIWVVLCGIFLTLAPRYYKASMIIAAPYNPVQVVPSENVPYNPGAPSMPGNMADTIYNRQDSRSQNFTVFQNIIRGYAIARFLREHTDICNKIIAYNWSVLSIPGKTATSCDTSDIHRHLQKSIVISPVEETDLRRIEYTHPDPEFALQLLNTIASQADQNIRSDDSDIIQSRLHTLHEQLQKTGNPQRRQSLAYLLTLLEQKQASIALDKHYSFRIIEDSYTDDRPAWPRKSLFLAIAIFLGVISGYLAFTIIRLREE